MLVTNHVLSGAVVGALVRRPLLAVPAGIASHFLLDAAPHWGRWRDERQFMRIAVADGLTGLAAMGAVAALARPERRAAVVAGMVAAALPDVDKPTHVFFGFSPFPDAVDRLHQRVQDEAPRRFWSHELPAALGFAGAFAALAGRRRGRTRP